MPKPRASKLESATARKRLAVRKKPYWARISPNILLGYRRNDGPGTWNVRHTGAGAEWIKRLALADDLEPADGKDVLTYWQALEAARTFVRRPDEAKDATRPATVGEALDAYAADLEARGGDPRNASRVLHALPASLASKPVVLVSASELAAWRDGLIARGQARSTVNRTRNALRAALSLAAKRDRRIVNRHVWEDDLEALPNATRARNVVLDDVQANALLSAAHAHDPALGLFTEVIAQTAARPSQVARLEVGDLDVTRSRLLMPRSGKGHPEKRAEKMILRTPVPIPQNLVLRLQREAKGRPVAAPLLTRNGAAWGHDPSPQYRRDFRLVVVAAGLDPDEVTIYALRHTAISRSILRGVPLTVVADLADTSEREIRQHYASLISHHADEIARKGLLDTEEREPASNVVSISA
jgi:integrase